MALTVMGNPEKELLQSVYETWKEIETPEGFQLTVQEQEAGLKVSKEGETAQIFYSRTCELFRGIGFLKQWIGEGIERQEIQEEPVFGHLTYMVDCSRNAVCSVEFVKEMIKKLALMGYDRLMLYTEDTYEIKEYPFFGYFRGRYTEKELKELDQFGAAFGIELVPCIQTLAHLNGIFHWRAFEQVRDTGDILCCGKEETYQLIEAMVATYARCCRSRIINIGMDEAEMIGRGRYLREFGYRERMEIMEEHLKRVVEICETYGYTCMMWSDMFFKMLNQDSYHSENLEIPEECREKIPENVSLIYWDYYSRSGEKYDSMMKLHHQLGKDIVFAGGAWKWNGFAPLLAHSVQAAPLALEACEKNGIRSVIVTGWGDNGGEAGQAVVYPVLGLYAEYCYEQNLSMEWIQPRILACTGADISDFLELDCLNLTPDNPSPGRVSVGPAKYLLYQDVLMGIYDRHVDPETYPAHFKACEEKLNRIAKKGGPYAYLFETLAALAAVLKKKSDLGIRLKDAYDQKDREQLKELAGVCRETAQLVQEFHEKLCRQWMKENKPFGLEIQNIRLGGTATRLLAAAGRIESYLAGETDRMEELEQERLLLDQRDNPGFRTIPLWDNNWSDMVSAGVM